MTLQSRLAIKIEERNQADQYWQSHDFMSQTQILKTVYKLYKAMWQDWLYNYIEDSCSSELYSEDITPT